jgi:hypothetical protein
MSELSDYLEDALLKHLCRDTSFTMPETYVALYSTNPADDNTGNELSGGGYARVRVYTDTTTAPYWTAPVNDGIGKVVKNSGDVTFPTATADWTTATHVAVLDAATSGNLLFYSILDASKTVLNGEVLKFEANNLEFKLQ